MISPYHGSFVLMRNKDSSGNESKGSVVLVVQGRSYISSTKTRDFLEVLLVNSISNSWRIKIQCDYFPPSTSHVRTWYMGLESA